MNSAHRIAECNGMTNWLRRYFGYLEAAYSVCALVTGFVELTSLILLTKISFKGSRVKLFFSPVLV